MVELPTYRTILFATDGSDYAALAERHALALALVTGARIEGVFVVDDHVASQFGALASEVLEELRADGRRALDEVTERAGQVGVGVQTHLVEGRAGPTIVAEAA